ncbi:SPOR domain-containing protein [Novosphingobium sp. ERN07]|uniref:SPOR domain-containing protein n=1 Tax=Novosphingobium sp. ERN07 TaxID=2726187 RepID=UPI00145753C8|nr:SPOR domain-containing protein [Novosphingobium sp. ERN07]NLR70683.1 SPOR domain-containing protein [Novosphingobium sp. ERN07]
MTNCFPFAQGTRLAVSLLLAATYSHALAQVDDDPDGPAVVSRPVVQSTAPSPSRELNAALARLATDPRNVPALSDAAEAALKLGDSDAAIGFLTRADEVQPGNARTKALIGKAHLADENPVEAIRAFDDAERAGGDTFAMAAERALAYDLVGDNGRAQRWYQVALSRGANAETTRRYAMSLAISGDRRGAEALLAPLIEKQDRAAWRTRTFAMAVTNGADEAVAIAYASMPQELASGIAPYLRFMPRLTPAQQAAAANFGRFPRAADMGRDDPRVVQYAALNPRAPRGAEAGLIPAGAPLGPSVASASEKPSREKRRRPGRDDGKVALAQATPRTPAPLSAPSTAQSAASQPAATQVVRSTPPASATPQRPAVLSALDVPPGTVRPPVPPIRRDVPASTVATPVQSTAVPVRTAALTPAPAPTPPSSSVPISNAPLPATQAQTSAVVPVQTPPRAQPSASAGFDLARVGGSTAGAVNAPPPVALSPAATTAAVTQGTATPAVTPPSAPVATPPAQPAASTVQLAQTPAAVTGTSLPTSAVEPARPADFALMFKAFEPPAEERSTTVAAVDITRLPPKPVAKPDPRGERPDGPTDVSRTPAKEVDKPSEKDAKSTKDAKAKDAKAAKDAKDAKAKKAQPSHPSRIWVQVLTGANKAVMDSEWRRLVKEAPELLRSKKPYLSPWRSNFRLLTGPFESEASAQEFVTKLKKSGVSSYQWTSPAGQAVDTLALK